MFRRRGAFLGLEHAKRRDASEDLEGPSVESSEQS